MMLSKNHSADRMRSIIRSEISDAIQSACEGNLAPYWQNYHLQNLETWKKPPHCLKEADYLIAQLKEAISSTEQISDAEDDALQMDLMDCEILFNETIEDEISILLFYNRSTKLYYSQIDVNPNISADNMRLYARSMERKLVHWASKAGAIASLDAMDSTGPDFLQPPFPTLIEAVIDSLLTLWDVEQFLA